jgi:hypothetical protein
MATDETGEEIGGNIKMYFRDRLWEWNCPRARFGTCVEIQVQKAQR